MAKGQSGTVPKWTKDNKTVVTTAKTVELVVFNDSLVPDIRDVNPGVVTGLTFYNSGLI